jgi:hypothetical protein
MVSDVLVATFWHDARINVAEPGESAPFHYLRHYH